MSEEAIRYFCGWDVVHACNYRCPYCFFIPSWTTAPERTNGRHLACAKADWTRFWERAYAKYGRFEIEIAGGEPFSYPDFLSLLREVTRRHRVRVVTNLSADAGRIAAEADPASVEFSASFHPHFAELEEFGAKLALLKKSGFGLLASVVAYPEFFERLPELKRSIEALGVRCFLNPFQGTFEGRTYPGAYTPEQGAYLRREAFQKDLPFRMRDESPLGKPCRAGQRYFRVWPDGVIYRCCASTELGEKPLGHIKDPELRLLDEPAPCPAVKCFAPNEIVHLVEPAPAVQA